jgi:hypothetical protein
MGYTYDRRVASSQALASISMEDLNNSTVIKRIVLHHAKRALQLVKPLLLDSHTNALGYATEIPWSFLEDVETVQKENGWQGIDKKEFAKLARPSKEMYDSMQGITQLLKKVEAAALDLLKRV